MQMSDVAVCVRALGQIRRNILPLSDRGPDMPFAHTMRGPIHEAGSITPIAEPDAHALGVLEGFSSWPARRVCRHVPAGLRAHGDHQLVRNGLNASRRGGNVRIEYPGLSH